MEEETLKALTQHFAYTAKHAYRTLVVTIGPNSLNAVLPICNIVKQNQKPNYSGVLWMSKTPIMPATSDKEKTEKIFKSTNATNCLYKETEKVLGNTFSILLIQDFQCTTPNILCRAIECIMGGGAILLMLSNLDKLQSLPNLLMEAHHRYCTDKYKKVLPLFNQRLLLSFNKCNSYIYLNEEMKVGAISNNSDAKDEIKSSELADIQSSSTDDIKCIIAKCKTVDQAKSLLLCSNELKQKAITSNIAITAGRGRGKSALLGLLIAYSISQGYGNIIVTAPTPDNLKVLFEFIIIGLNELGYENGKTYTIQKKGPFVQQICITKSHRQTIHYESPIDIKTPLQADLLVIDEAAAIPLPLVKDMIGPYQVIFSSTINGYEGTGRSLSLKLIAQLREKASEKTISKSLKEVQLSEPIRYGRRDPVECWLTDLLCLDCTKAEPIGQSYPHPNSCALYAVSREALFSGQKTSEKFLKKVMSLFVSSHYKNSPNDMHLLADAPAHEIFVLLPQLSKDCIELPDVLCAIQVCYEGGIDKNSIAESINKGLRPSGDLIPWVLIEQFQNNKLGELKGIRIVRIACHPDCQSMGYGSRALQLLQQFYTGSLYIAQENKESTSKPHKTLLFSISERMPPEIDYIGTSFGLTNQLYKFWARNELKPIYIRQTQNDTTGEYTCIMLQPLSSKMVGNKITKCDTNWPNDLVADFKKRFMGLLGYDFRKFHVVMVMNMLDFKQEIANNNKQLYDQITVNDCLRLESYSNNMIDYHLIIDIIPLLSRMYFTQALGITINQIQQSILLGMGLQYKTIEALSRELSLETSQAVSLLNKLLRKINGIIKDAVAAKTISKIEAKIEAKEEQHIDSLFTDKLTK